MTNKPASLPASQEPHLNPADCSCKYLHCSDALCRSMMALEEKRIETRVWQTKYRGPIAIHAAASLPPIWLGRSRLTEEFRNEVADVLNCRRDHVDSEVEKLPRGKVLCVVNLRDIQETKYIREILCERERIFGNYEDGRYAWETGFMFKFDNPIPAKGHQQLWNWTKEIREL